MKVNVQLVQVNSSYGNQYFIPYSVGLLQAYVNKFEKIKENFNFLKLIYKQEISIEESIKDIENVDIVAQSCYVWNWQFNLSFAQLIKEKNPNALIILGGPQVPDKIDGFFKKYPFVDILCHGEGEVAFCKILEEYLHKQNYGAIEGVSYNNTKQDKVTSTPRRPAPVELESIPSPYLEGTFDELLKDDVIWQASWETNRGCPYRCTFCVWGAEYFNKIRKFPLEERLLSEIEWFSTNKIELVFGCDANFGMFKRDIEIAEALVNAKDKFGYPRKFRVCNAKNSNERVYQISEILSDAGMSKGTSLSAQSMNSDVLDIIKRKNIGIDKFKDLMSKFNKSSMSTYTEIILPLPGETYQSFLSGLELLLQSGQHNQIHIYNCTVLANSEMASDEYMKEYGIETIEAPVFRAHVDNLSSHIKEKETIAVGTKTMSRDEWKKSQEYSWAIQTFHTLGLLQYVAIVCANRYNLSYTDFYVSLLDFADKNPSTIMGAEIREIRNSINNLLDSKTHGQLVPQYQLDIIWPPEEASLLRILEKKEIFYNEVNTFIEYVAKKYNCSIEREFLEELIDLQKEIMVHYSDSGQCVDLKLNYNLVDFITNVKNGIPAKLIRFEQPDTFKVTKSWKFPDDKEQFARQIIWYGRKGGKYLNDIERVYNS